MATFNMESMAKVSLTILLLYNLNVADKILACISTSCQRVQPYKIRSSGYIALRSSNLYLTSSAGNPTPYLPVSIRLPEHFQHLRSQQLLTSHNQAWWPSHYQPSLLSLQDQIMDAMSEPFNPLPSASFKTSLTHPIKSVLPLFG